METVSKLLNKKSSKMEKIYQITREVHFTDDEEENVEVIAELYEKREEIFNEIREIDSKIFKLDNNASLVNNNILSLRDKIVDLDKKLQPRMQKMKVYISSKMKDVKTGKKITNHFKTNIYSEGGLFDSQG